jgi:hypothetical protein
VRALSKVFRANYLAALQAASARGQLPADVSGIDLLRSLRGTPWVVYAKPPFGGLAQVLAYLGRYTHRIAIRNERILALRDGLVHFRWRDYADANRAKVMALPAEEFLRRFLHHVVPAGFQRIRHFGLLANRRRTQALARCRELLHASTPPAPPPRERTVELPQTRWVEARRAELLPIPYFHVVFTLPHALNSQARPCLVHALLFQCAADKRLALRTVAVAAGVVDGPRGPAAVAALEMTAEGRRAAGLDRAQGAARRRSAHGDQLGSVGSRSSGEGRSASVFWARWK